MAEHLSEFALDELVLAPNPEHPHLACCAPCRQRLAERWRAREALVQRPEFERTYARIAVSLGGGWKGRSALGAAFAVTTVVALLFVLAPSGSDLGDRVKGAARVAAISGERPASLVSSGERITFVVSPAGHRYALLFAVAEDGDVTQLWPVDALTSGPLSGSASERLTPDFRITPGSFTVHAIFSHAPISTARAKVHAQEAIRQGRIRGQSPLNITIEPLSPRGAVATYRVRVRSER